MVRLHENGVVSSEATDEHPWESAVDWVPVTSLAEENAVFALKRKDIMFELDATHRADQCVEQQFRKQVHIEASSVSVAEFASCADRVLIFPVYGGRCYHRFEYRFKSAQKRSAHKWFRKGSYCVSLGSRHSEGSCQLWQHCEHNRERLLSF